MRATFVVVLTTHARTYLPTYSAGRRRAVLLRDLRLQARRGARGPPLAPAARQRREGGLPAAPQPRQPRFSSHRVAGCRLPAAGCWAAGCWVPGAGCRVLAAGLLGCWVKGFALRTRPAPLSSPGGACAATAQRTPAPEAAHCSHPGRSSPSTLRASATGGSSLRRGARRLG